MQRRHLLKRITAGAIGAVLGLVPLGAGVAFLLDPLRRRAQRRGFVRVASLDTLPLGQPRRFTVTGTRTDAWSTYPNEPLGAVYLIRRSDTQVDAFQVICPHAGCFVDFKPADRKFHCPCHNSTFKLDGSIANPASPAPRGLDPLDVKIQGRDILVQYQEYRQGVRQRIPLA